VSRIDVHAAKSSLMMLTVTVTTESSFRLAALAVEVVVVVVPGADVGDVVGLT